MKSGGSDAQALGSHCASMEISVEGAWHSLREGRLAEAKAGFMDHVAGNSGDAKGWYGYALTLHQLGELSVASQAAETALRLEPSNSRYAYLCGYVAVDLDDLDTAARRFSLATALDPHWVAAHRSLGEVLLKQGRAGHAAAVFETAWGLRPRDGELLGALASARWVAGRWEDARSAATQAESLRAGQPLACLVLAKAALREGLAREALGWLDQCLRAAPSLAEGWLLRVRILRQLGDPEIWVACDSALKALPNHAPLWVAYGDLLWEAGETGDASASFRRAVQCDPGSFRAAAGASLLLPQVYGGFEALCLSRAAYVEGLDRLVADEQRFRGRSDVGLPDTSWTNFFLAYQGENDVQLQSRYGDLLARVLAAREPRLCEFRPLRPRSGRLRIGFLSHFFFNCTVGRYFSSWVLDLDPAQFEVYVYYTNSRISSDTERIRSAASRFHHVVDMPLRGIAEGIIADSLDALVYPELGMHADTFVLAGLRLAPLQIAAWGHPTTTGLPTIDAYLSCSEMEPPGAQGHYREALRGLPGLGTRYPKPFTDSTKRRSDFGFPDDATLYLCPQSLFKVHPENDSLFAQVLAADPRGRLVYFEGRNALVTGTFRQRLETAFRGAGIDPEGRLLQLPYMSHADYLRVNQLCDVMLDTVRWSGGNTALDALAMGLPIVTLPGEMMRGRQSVAMMQRLGLEELVAKDAAEYVRYAVAVGADPGRRLALRSRIMKKQGDLFDDPEPTHKLDSVLKDLIEERL